MIAALFATELCLADRADKIRVIRKTLHPTLIPPTPPVRNDSLVSKRDIKASVKEV